VAGESLRWGELSGQQRSGESREDLFERRLEVGARIHLDALVFCDVGRKNEAFRQVCGDRGPSARIVVPLGVPLGQALALRLPIDAAFHEEKGRAMPARERPCRGTLERRGEAGVENDGTTRLEGGLSAVEDRAVDARR